MDYRDAIEQLAEWQGSTVDVALTGTQDNDPHPVLSVSGELQPLEMDGTAARVSLDVGCAPRAHAFNGFWLRPAWVERVELVTVGPGAAPLSLRIYFDNATVLSISP